MARKDLDRLTAEVGETTTVMDSGVKLIGGLAQLLRDNSGDPAAINALADQLDAKQAELSAAIFANTPAESGVSTPPSPVGQNAAQIEAGRAAQARGTGVDPNDPSGRRRNG